MNRCSCRCRCSARLLETSTESNSESIEFCRTPQGKNQLRESEHDGREEYQGLRCGTPGHQQSYFTLPATVREPHMDSHHAGVRWDCKPAISTAHAQDSSVFTRRRMSTIIQRHYSNTVISKLLRVDYSIYLSATLSFSLTGLISYRHQYTHLTQPTSYPFLRSVSHGHVRVSALQVDVRGLHQVRYQYTATPSFHLPSLAH